MLINWFTVFAQIVNFLILVTLLRWVLYKPILRVMHDRQKQLEERWQEAENLQAQAEQEIAIYQQQQQEFQQQQAALLAEARLTAEQERQHQLAQLQQDIADQRATWQADLQQEQEAFLRTLRQKIIHQTSAIARQALSDLANVELEQQIIRMFCTRLHHLEEPQRQAVVQALSQTHQSILIRSSFLIPSDLRQQLIDELHSQFPVSQPIEFVTISNSFYGIEVKFAGQEIVWSLDTYLQTLEQQLSTALTQEEASRHEPCFSASAGRLF